MKKIVFIGALCALSSYGFSQDDTLRSTQNFKEVQIQGEFKVGDIDSSSNLQNSIDHLLSTTPGITMIKRGNYALEPTIRGLNAGQINVTIDGMQMFGACTDRMDPISSYVEPTNLEKIKLNTTPNGDQSGSSIGGEIDFSLMKAKIGASKKISGKVGAGYQTNANNIQTLGTVQYSAKKWALLVNGIYRKADNYYAANRKEIRFSQFEKWNAGANLAVALNKNNKIYLDYIQDEGYDIGYPALTMDVGFAKAYISAFTHKYENKLNKFRSLETKLFFNYVNHTMDDTKRPEELVPMHMDMPGTSRTFGGFSKAKFLLSPKHILNVKLNAYQNDLHAEMTMYPDFGSEMFMLTIPDGVRRTAGINVSDTWFVNSKLKLTYGARAEVNASDITTEIGEQTLTSFYNGDAAQVRYSGNVFAQADYSFTRKVAVFGGVNYAQRPPSLQETYGFYLFNRVDNHDYIGNPDIMNETSINTNIGIELKYSKVAVTLKGFANYFSNYIIGMVLPSYSNMTIGADGVKQYTNIDNALLTGGELTLNWKPVDNITVNSVNSYSFGTDDQGGYLPYIPPFKSINSIQYNYKMWSVKVEHIGAMAQNNVSTERYGEGTTPAFNIMNFSVHKHFKLKKDKAIHAQFDIQNIFDTPYYEHLDVLKIQRQGINFVFKTTFVF
ncbi:TonB-dependent receptor plug domain-containing protein [Brumimicrobium aurantiacum]|uniref:TonB-dependent receptor n=1 Tax=Brumimicrobium aurantiacum TaxID=1737063 RepID=A0A3E1F0R3_9FLAO|nr:TonB-dependent receptor [Brumimicrobium aurantiacum]RFC55395.1 TonB-dependent receptor [Brumimicrobium aurantiacum]